MLFTKEFIAKLYLGPQDLENIEKEQNKIKDVANTQYFTKLLKNFAIIYGLSIYIFWYFIYDSAASLEPSQVNNLFTYSGFIPFLYITICNVMAYCELSKDDIIDVEIYKDVRDKSQAEQLKIDQYLN